MTDSQTLDIILIVLSIITVMAFIGAIGMFISYVLRNCKRCQTIPIYDEEDNIKMVDERIVHHYKVIGTDLVIVNCKSKDSALQLLHDIGYYYTNEDLIETEDINISFDNMCLVNFKNLIRWK